MHLYSLQQKEGPKLTEEINFNYIGLQKQNMKLKLAAEIFFGSVANSTEFLEYDLKDPKFKSCAFGLLIYT